MNHNIITIPVDQVKPAQPVSPRAAPETHRDTPPPQPLLGDE